MKDYQRFFLEYAHLSSGGLALHVLNHPNDQGVIDFLDSCSSVDFRQSFLSGLEDLGADEHILYRYR